MWLVGEWTLRMRNCLVLFKKRKKKKKVASSAAQWASVDTTTHLNSLGPTYCCQDPHRLPTPTPSALFLVYKPTTEGIERSTVDPTTNRNPPSSSIFSDRRLFCLLLCLASTPHAWHGTFVVLHLINFPLPYLVLVKLLKCLPSFYLFSFLVSFLLIYYFFPCCFHILIALILFLHWPQ